MVEARIYRCLILSLFILYANSYFLFQRKSTYSGLPRLFSHEKEELKGSGGGKGFAKKPEATHSATQLPNYSDKTQLPPEIANIADNGFLSDEAIPMEIASHPTIKKHPFKLPEGEPQAVEEAKELTEEEMIVRSKMYVDRRFRKEQSIQGRIDILREEEQMILSEPGGGTLPEYVADRMIKRIAFFFGVPVFGGLGLFVAGYFASKQYDITIPPVVMGTFSQAPFIIALLGISYGILSSSWDEEPGSLLGIREFKRNIQNIKDGFQRSKEELRLKDDIEKDIKELKLLEEVEKNTKNKKE
eukprot:gene9617-10632_t